MKWLTGGAAGLFLSSVCRRSPAQAVVATVVHYSLAWLNAVLKTAISRFAGHTLSDAHKDPSIGFMTVTCASALR